ncbi:MAG: PQQ-binding-like beta-propeller repeat protein [Myxococcota bacterium]
MHRGALIGCIAALWVLSASAAAASGPIGWLGDGSGTFSAGTVPTGWTSSAPGGWSVKMPAWSNASPVVVGDRIIVTAEPLTVLCVSAKTGKTLWSHDVSYLDTVGDAERARVTQERAEAARVAAALRAKERELNKLKRAMRKARGSQDAAARSQALLAEIGPLKEQLDGYAHLRPPEPIDVMGTAPSTPVSDGTSVYALLGNGVLASFSLDGALRWATHLGHPTQRMRGFHKGQTASPLLVDGVLVVALNHLIGIDPATGAERWRRSESYLDFGPPRATTIDGVALVVTPMGEVVRVADGALLADNLGASVYFVSPLTQGRRVYFVGATTDPDLQERTAVAYELSGPLSGLRANEVWRRGLPREKTYATPLLHDGLIYALGIRGSLVVLDASSGQLVYETVVPLGHGDVMPSPVVSGDRLVMMGGSGEVVIARTGRSYQPLYQAKLGEMRATPALVDGRIIVRDLDRLWSLTAPR